ncbi:MAG: DUF3127 domain-containing protein [Bacteroidales bacterium]|nr:DUF3127 domain-containing protein [Bacteroidales bacterium]MDE5956522.1 DUF3127 domain-containing protein [Bacteroidales bacterium]MDE6147339.1 DUF3127 domain-containing protein [Bacteroidales bacterium]
MAMELEGRIARKMNVQTGTSARGAWAKQEFIFEYQEGNFPSQVCMNVWGEDKVKELERHQVGDRVKVSFNLSSREYNGRWYTDVRAWRIEPVGQPAGVNDYAAGAVAGGAGYMGVAQQPSAGGYDYAGSAGSYAAPTGAPLPSADDMSAPVSDDDLPF